MSGSTIEERLRILEDEVARIKNDRDAVSADDKPWWKRIIGVYANDPAFDEAMALGREWRESYRPQSKDEVAPL